MHETLEKMLIEKGFKTIKKLEYFDSNGEFESISWDLEDGYIRRSKENDPRNWRGDIIYSSLIFDAIK